MKERINQWKAYLKTHKRTIILLVVAKTLVKIGIVGYFLLGSMECRGQTVNQLIRSGNKLYHKQKFNNATEEYTKALQQDPKNGKAIFNHSDALYQLKEYDKAAEQFKAVTQSAVEPGIKAKAYHNLGNCYYKQEKYEESVKAFKESLKINPEDKDTKYNLMMAMAKLKQNQGGGGNDQQQDKKDKQDQQQKQQQQQQQQQNQQGQQQQPAQNQQQKEQQQPKLTNEEAQRLLEALGNEENNVQQKLDKQKGEGQKVKVQKDW